MLVSFSYCQECYEACAEPEAVLEHLMDLAHSDINNLHPQLKELLTWKGNDYLPLSSWIKTRTKSVSNCA